MGPFSLLQRLRPMHQALHLEPLAETINPVVGWQALLPHAEAVTSLCIDVQFDRVVGGPPCTIQGQTWLDRQLIIIGESNEERRSIGWNCDIFCFAPLMFDCSGVPAPHHVSKMRTSPHVLSGNHTRVSWMVVPAHESRRPCSHREPGLLPVLIALSAH